jgi:hypothetical protein
MSSRDDNFTHLKLFRNKFFYFVRVSYKLYMMI